MDTYEKEYTPRPENRPGKRSPYADSPYECAFTQPAERAAEAIAPASAPRKKRSVKPLLVFVLVVLCCVATALGLTDYYRKQMQLMETAMDEKFAALEQLYRESQQANSSQLPAEGPMTPGQVYAKNVQAVVAVNALYNDGGQSFGSGFLISADGYVVTNYHVIQGAAQVSVTTHDGKTLKAEVIGAESTNDIALVKVEGENMPCAVMGRSDSVAVGDQVAAIGNPLGELTATLTVGYISAKDRIVSTDGTVINMLQTDAAINSGNSGGPLFNMNGEVIGITSAKYSGNTESGAAIEGLGFAIPTDDVAGILADLKEFGYVTGAYLGVYVRDVDASGQSYGLPAGVYVEDVVKGLAADRAGVRAGDIILNLGGYDVDSMTTLTRVLRRFEAGETVTLTVYRGGRNMYLTVTLDEKPVQTQEQEPTESVTPESGTNDFFDKWFDFFAPFFGNE